MKPKKQRGTVIFETKKGILMTSIHGHTYTLPGSGARRSESVLRAGLRALEEETGVQTQQASVLFTHESNEHEHTVIYVRAKGKAKLRGGIKHIKYFNEGDEISMSPATRQIISMFLEYKAKNKL